MEDDNADPQHEEENPSPPTKKVRLFSAKEFRQNLSGPDKLSAMKEFRQLCQDPQSQHYIYDYLENGGGCLELFQLLETSDVPAMLVLQSVHYVLYQIVSNYARFHSTTYEACRYFLNTHLALVNKTLGLSSSTAERKAMLKLLTVIVTFSSNLAKEILLHVNFNPSNMEVLTKQSGEKDSVRNAFIHFLLGFLVEGEYPTISALLEKKWLLASIIKGLQYDSAKTVSMVMLALKNNILENISVSKTTKMNVFNTLVIKDIVNLYNWKGLQGAKNKKVQAITVNEQEKSRVNEAVHSLLLVLCTSHKLGVIFRDHQLGLGKKTHNNLMYTVLESLERPWEHSYAGELVTKICGACPDLVKTMWANLKPFLELRATARWLSAVKYATVLVQEVGPDGMEFCARELTVVQLAQVIQMLVVPAPILKVIIPENHAYEQPSIKHHILYMLVEFLKSTQKFLTAAQNWLKPQDLRALKNSLQEHIARNFLDAQSVLKDWTESDDKLGPYSTLSHLEIIFDLLDLYESMCPQLLESLSGVNLQSFLKEIQELPEEVTSLQIRAIKLFISFEPSFFAPKTNLFGVTLPLIFGFYFETKDSSAKTTLKLLFKNTWIFEGCLEEIDFWIDAIRDLSSYDVSIGEYMVGIVNQTSGNIFEYFSQMSKLLDSSESLVDKQNFQDILESLNDESLQNSVGFSVKHQTLSPLFLGALEYLLGADQNKHFKNYFNTVAVNLTHFQTSPSLITSIILNERYQGLVSKHVANYAKSWVIEGNIAVLSKTKSHLSKTFSTAFLEGDLDEFFQTNQEELAAQPEQAQNCLNQALFYFCNLTKENLSETHANNCKKAVTFLMAKQEPRELAGKIFGHPFLLQTFSPLNLGKTGHHAARTSFLVDVVKEFQSSDLGRHLGPFRAKLVASLKKVLKKSKAGKKLLEVLEVFGLQQQQCLDVLDYCSRLSIEDLDQDCLFFYYNVVVFALKTFMKQLDELEPVHDGIVLALMQLLTFLHKNQEKFDTSSCASVLKNYLEVFPHNLKNVTPELFESILVKTEFCKENSLLAGFLLSKRKDFLDLFVQNLPKIAGKKGLMLPLLEAAVFMKADDEVLRTAFRHFKPSIMNALQKPQKAGQYFEVYRDVLEEMMKKCMPKNVCRSHMEKMEKFEVSEPFHAQMLLSMFSKSIFDTKEEIAENHLNNALLTLVHLTNPLFKKKSKAEDESTKLNEIVQLTSHFLEKLVGNEALTEISFRTLCQNESFQLYCKFCLKFGLPAHTQLIKLLKSIVQLVNFEESEARLLLDMAGSHSEFLEVILSETSECKVELLELVLVLCQRWPVLMERNHVPVLLAAYRATVRPADRIILSLLQMYEKAASKTSFYDFKPFLWSTAAATHYSVRQDMQKSLWRQPKMSNILDILQREWVHNTINNYPLNLGLTATKNISLSQNVYDLAFLLPLFSSLLAPESKASTYSFVRSGGLSLTIVALSSNDKELRLAACHVLARLHFHVEATQDKKGKFLWLRFIEAVCRGTAAMEDCKLNNFSSIFWAKMALILTDPLQPLYMPLSHYLTAREAPDLSSVPELYTFLHASDVNYKETRAFILEILRDGLRTDHDFTVAFRAAAFKLIMELFISCVADVDTKVLILGVFERACKLKEGIKFLCSNCGLLSWLYEVVANLGQGEENILSSAMEILRALTTNKTDLKLIDCNIVSLIVASVIDKGLINYLRKQDLQNLLQVILNIFDENSQFLNKERLTTLVKVSNSKKCLYLVKYGSEYSVTVRNCNEVEDCVEMILTNLKRVK